jgi:uncharacterized membrane protein YidH (DUF202 family)
VNPEIASFVRCDGFTLHAHDSSLSEQTAPSMDRNVMSENGATQQVRQAESDPRVGLAVIRTELAWERTLLAWIRTTFTLMSAGIAFDKGLQILHQQRLLAGTAIVRNGHIVGLTLTAASCLLLMAVTGYYVQAQRTLAQLQRAPTFRFRPVVAASCLVILLCIVVFALLILNGG